MAINMKPARAIFMACVMFCVLGQATCFHQRISRPTMCHARSLWSSRSGSPQVERVAVVGGGLAGLAVVSHLLGKNSKLHITVFDITNVGMGGASSVAGGLLHPLSPRGKLVHHGLAGLAASNYLVSAAKAIDSNVQLCDELFRLAMNEKQAQDLQSTARQLPDLCQWLNAEELLSLGVITETTNRTLIQGGLRLHSGCQVIHVPSYLRALWKHCQEKNKGTAWKLMHENASTGVWDAELGSFDTVVWCSGSGLFSSSISMKELPAQLVRGQSIEMRLPDDKTRITNALLSGKYLSPLPDKSLVLIGASHEFRPEPMPRDDLVSELKERTQDMAPHIWKTGVIERITQGTRVQSQRGKFGRLPIVGRVDHPAHSNSWILTGLSSRGLLYHALYGNMLADAVLSGSEDAILDQSPEALWWRHKS